jgi:hypothetical protein
MGFSSIQFDCVQNVFSKVLAFNDCKPTILDQRLKSLDILILNTLSNADIPLLVEQPPQNLELVPHIVSSEGSDGQYTVELPEVAFTQGR